ncbi:hypothetical protein FQZ97_1241150 [compost metagenome]
MLAHGVHFQDVGAAVQQLAVDALLVFEREAVGRQREQRGTATGDEAEHQVVRREALGELQDTLRGGQARGVGHRVRGFHHPDALLQTCRARRCVVVTRDDQA